MNRIGIIRKVGTNEVVGEIQFSGSLTPQQWSHLSIDLNDTFIVFGRMELDTELEIAHWRNGEARPAPPKDFNFDVDWKDEPGPPYPTEFPEDGTL